MLYEAGLKRGKGGNAISIHHILGAQKTLADHIDDVKAVCENGSRGFHLWVGKKAFNKSGASKKLFSFQEID